MNGEVVHGVAGRRYDYRPIESRLAGSSAPVTVARAFRDRLGLTELYVADLDAIAGRPPALAAYAALRKDGFTLWVDAGMKQAADADVLVGAGIENIVAGLETIAGPQTLEQLCQKYGPARIVFSLDLKNREPLGRLEDWKTSSAFEIGQRAATHGSRRLIVLDLARVGVGDGTGTEALCSQLLAKLPELEITAGGGVRGLDDLRRLKQAGVHAVLAASALHDGRIQRKDLQDL